jgi:hypothetical protein
LNSIDLNWIGCGSNCFITSGQKVKETIQIHCHALAEASIHSDILLILGNRVRNFDTQYPLVIPTLIVVFPDTDL